MWGKTCESSVTSDVYKRQGGGNGVDGLVGVGHGVEERLHGALDQVDKRLLDGELGRSAQRCV